MPHHTSERIPNSSWLQFDRPLLCLWLGLGMASLVACRSSDTLPPGSSKHWDAMDAGARARHMTKVVMPAMKAEFQAFDAERFADFNCATCHGAGAKARGYAMPNPELPVLHPSGIYREPRKNHPEMADFMWDRVEPKMAELLGKPRYVVAHDKGFNCSGCHIQRKGG